MKKIYAILVQHWLSTKGGITTHFYNLIEGLKKRNVFNLFVITPDRYKGEGVFNLNDKNKIFLFLTAFYALFKISPHIIHCAEHGYMLLASVIYKFFKPGVKIIFSFHTDMGSRIKKAHYFHNIILNWAINKCDLVLCISKYLLSETIRDRKLKIAKPVEILSAGVTPKDIGRVEVEEFKNNFRLDDSYPVLCTIGVFEWYGKVEGIKLLLESFKKLGLPKGKLVIVGDGKYRTYLEQTASKLSLTDEVVFAGYLNDPFLALATCDIYCHLALQEAFGNAILEAMVMGKPIVAVKRGGIPEIIEHKINGLLVEPVIEEVVNSIMLLLNDSKLRNRIAQNAKITAENEYNSEKVVNRYLELISHICSF